MAADDQREARQARLGGRSLYLVCGLPGDPPDPAGLPDLVREAVEGGVEIVQLRDKSLGDDELTAVANAIRALCQRIGALLVVNDRPQVAAEVQADGVHVGQEDMPVAEVRELVGEDMLIGLSTHTPEQIDAVDPELVDYIGVGPIHETPTKPGRPAVGLGLVRYAAAHSPVPFFAIGGLDADNLQEVLQAGAERVVVLRAIADSPSPEEAARELRGLIAASRGEASP